MLPNEGKNGSRQENASAASQTSPGSTTFHTNVSTSAGASKSSSGGDHSLLTSAPYSAGLNPSSQHLKRSQTPAQPNGPKVTTPKRQRVLSPNRRLDLMSTIPGMMPPINISLQPREDPSMVSQQQSQQKEASPANYLYSPLPNQPPPVLIPANAQSSGSGSINSGQSEGSTLQNQAGSSQTAGTGYLDHDSLPQRNRVSRPHVSQNEHVPSNAARPDGAPDASGESQSSRGRSSTSGARTESGKGGATGGSQGAVQGLTFGDDWRDPFMGFYQGTD